MSPPLDLPKDPVEQRAATRVVVDPDDVEALLRTAGPGELPSRRDLLLQALLHLPRLARPDGTIDVLSAAAEIERLRASRSTELAPLRATAAPPPLLPALEQLKVRVVGADDAKPILSHFHYLRAFREDSVNVAALYQDRIVALCSVSPLDLPMLADRLPISSAQEAAVISRVFVFDWAPRNLVSYLLSRVEQSKAVNEDVRMLLTYVNPNMGFTGASYKAANWQRLGFETGTRYAYLHGGYITDRRLLSLTASDRMAVEYSRMPLRPLILLGRFLDEGLSRSAAQRADFDIERAPAAALSAILT